MGIYDAFTTRFDLASAVASLEVRDLARVIGRHPSRDEYPDLSTRELAREVITEAIDRVLTANRMRGTIRQGERS